MAESLQVNSPAFWEEIYQGGRAGWDLGGPTPVFRSLLADIRGAGQATEEFPPGRIVVPGAGRGHDAREFARHGFDVTAVDFAENAVQSMRELNDPVAPVKIVQQDIFQLPPEWDGTFDYFLEYTCFCAIDPHRRAEYADVVTRLLKPGGVYIDLAFPLDSHAGGPPFAVSLPEILRLFGERGFKLLQRGRPDDSVEARRGMEELLIFVKAGGG
jgi:SAM-dependent methyltransferase